MACKTQHYLTADSLPTLACIAPSITMINHEGASFLSQLHIDFSMSCHPKCLVSSAIVSYHVVTGRQPQALATVYIILGAFRVSVANNL